VHYISPEQARGDVTDEKSDIYSIGAMLYEMLTGVKPFDGDNPVSVALMHMQDEAEPPRSINDSIPEGLEEIVVRAMQKEPQKRYQSASEMIKDIDEFKKNPAIVFEYTYITEKAQYYGPAAASRAAAVYESNKAPEQIAAPAKKQKTALRSKNRLPDEETDLDFDDYDGYIDETVSKSSYFVVVLTAIAAVVIILVVGFIAYLILNVFPPATAETKQMPDLRFYNYTEAKQLYARNFTLQLEREEFSREFPEGAIISHRPEAGEDYVDGKGVVRAVVSRGPQLAEVPNTYNLEFTLAEARLKSEGFSIVVKHAYSEDVKVDHVIRTEPERGTKDALYGSEVFVFLSMGSEEPDVLVPSLVGGTIVAARATIGTDLTIQVEEVDNLAPEGTILEQNPKPQTDTGEIRIVPKGSLITLTVSNGKAPTQDAVITFRVPDGGEGKGTFNCYFNGVLSGTKTIDNIAFASYVSVDVSGDGIQRIFLEAVNESNGKKAQIGEYTVDFTRDPPEVTENAFSVSAFDSVFGNGFVTTTYSDPFFPYDPFETTTQPDWGVTLPIQDDDDFWSSIFGY
jgi:serine/threonine-protein kinase